jgi:hypothetical protein
MIRNTADAAPIREVSSMMKYRLVITGRGLIYDGESATEANRQFAQVVTQSKTAGSRYFGERVTLFRDYEIMREYRPSRS